MTHRQKRQPDYRVEMVGAARKRLDVGLLAPLVATARENLAVEQIDAVADQEYYMTGDIEACEAAGATPHVPKPVRSPSKSKGLFA